MRITQSPGCGGSMVAQVNFRIGATAARVQTVATGGDAGLIEARLDRQVTSLQGQHHGQPDTTRGTVLGSGSTTIARRKECRLLRCEPSRAVAVMDAMDYNVHLFTDAETGDDAVVYRAGPSGLRLARQHRMHPPRSRDELFPGLTVHPHPTPILTETVAAARFRSPGLPFVFFTDPATGRGRLLYARYAGGLGLVVPVDRRSK